jgi:hypothetical protein
VSKKAKAAPEPKPKSFVEIIKGAQQGKMIDGPAKPGATKEKPKK